MLINYNELIQAPHVLIAGSTGSGKSTLIHGIMTALLPHKPQLGLIDPKRVELLFYRDLPFTQFYARECDSAVGWLEGVINQIEHRYKEMARSNVRICPYKHEYIIIDELADLMIQDKKNVSRCLQRITQLGRAANVHLIAATQSPDRTHTLPAPIKLNFTDKIALRCDTAIESRQVIGIKGAEELPIYGHGIWRSPHGLRIVEIPYYSDSDIEKLVSKFTK